MEEYHVYRNFAIQIPEIRAGIKQPGDYMDKEWTLLTQYKTNVSNKIITKEKDRIPTRIEVQNLTSNIYTSSGYVMELRIEELFDESIHWIDSLQSTVLFNEYNRSLKQIPSNISIKIRRLSGPDDFTTAVNGAEQFKENFVDNGYLFFSLVFYYPVATNALTTYSYR